MSDLERLQRKLDRAIAARKQAEVILEKKALELYNANQALKKINSDLEKEINKRSQALIKSEFKYRSIIENMNLGLLEVDLDQNITKAYPLFCQMVGYSEDELLGQNAQDLLVVKDFIPILEEQHILRNKGEGHAYEIQIRRKNGEIIWTMISGAPFLDIDGNVIGSIGIHYDITDRKNLQSELENAKAIAENAQKAETQFLASMSHEIRTPLNAIIGMSHLIHDTNLSSEQKEYMEILLSSANILQSLISDILDISKIDAGTIEVQQRPFDIVQLLRSLERTFQVKLDSKPVNLILNLDPSINTLIIGDELLINQILLNLISNAEKFTQEGAIHVNIKSLQKDQDEYLLRFEVNDTGIGIASDKIDLIFQQFKQASAEIRETYGGTGLGLAITKKLVGLMGGDITVSSALNRGTSMSFELKFKNSGIALQEKESVTFVKKEYSDVKKPVLVVEDNKMNQKYITKLLEKWNLRFDLAEDGIEAVEMAKSKEYSMIFMDLQMPRMTGNEATNIIRTTENPNKNAPIIALTASTLLSKKQEALALGMSDFLSKPFNPKGLSEIIESYIDRSPPLSFDESREDFKFNSKLNAAYLNQMFDGDLEYARDMFETFLISTPPDFKEIENLLNEEQILEAGRRAHKIKPTFTMVGLDQLGEDLQKLEKMASEGELTKSIELYHKIKIYFHDHIGWVQSDFEKLKKVLA